MFQPKYIDIKKLKNKTPKFQEILMDLFLLKLFMEMEDTKIMSLKKLIIYVNGLLNFIKIKIQHLY